MKILVISLAGIGDTLIATPLIRELRENFPGVTIDALVRWPGAKDLLEHNPNVNRVFQKELMTCGKFEVLHFFRLLRRERYQLSINTHPQGPRLYRVAAWLAGAEVRISHEYERFTWLDRLLVTATLPQDYSRHSIENNFDILPLIGAKKKLASHETEFFLEPGDEQLADDFLAKQKLSSQKILGIHVGSGGTKNLRLKRWPLKNYAGLVRRLNQKRPDIRILLFGGPEEINDHPVVLAQANRDLTVEVKTQSLRQTAALMKRCSAFLSVDTVLMHVAAAMKVPNQIVIEAPTLNPTNLPYANPFTLVKNPVVAGRNLDYYRYDGGDIKGTREELLACMASITVENVYDTVNKAI
ncbi:MAG TPA: glycosyltransferase family 9 protein [Candidatus Limnocylindrales bacterium]|nr:glycosyltransferase family 9 protein [Candidatus Limnocylindrales bacterium]